jgi:hypothetical protein
MEIYDAYIFKMYFLSPYHFQSAVNHWKSSVNCNISLNVHKQKMSPHVTSWRVNYTSICLPASHYSSHRPQIVSTCNTGGAYAFCGRWAAACGRWFARCGREGEVGGPRILAGGRVLAVCGRSCPRPVRMRARAHVWPYSTLTHREWACSFSTLIWLAASMILVLVFTYLTCGLLTDLDFLSYRIQYGYRSWQNMSK